VSDHEAQVSDHEAQAGEQPAEQPGRDDAQTIIARIGATIASTLTVDEVISLIARQVCEAFGASSADIHRYSAETDTLDYVASWGVAEGFTEDGAGVGESYSPDIRPSFTRVVRERQISEVHRDDPDLPPAEAAEMDLWGEKALLDAPLEYGGHVIGVLGIVQSDSPRRFSDDERRLFSQIAVLAAIAIHNADVFTTLERLAITDDLTGLYNHRHFYQRLGEEVARAQRYGLALSLLIIDIDDFKRYNDAFGHRAGDAVLRDLSTLLQAQTRLQVDLVARYGGEEFVVILPSTAAEGAATAGERLRRAVAGELLGGPAQEAAGKDAAQPAGPGAAVTLAERIRRSVAGRQFGPAGAAAPMTVSVGTASLGVHALTADGLVEAADRALYRAKDRGKNRVEVAAPIERE